jgi:hypothetical protein
MPVTKFQGPDGRIVKLDIPEGDPGPTETELDEYFASSAPAKVEGSQGKTLPSATGSTPGTFDLSAAVDQAGNIVRQVAGGAADAVAGLADTATVIPRALGVDIPSLQQGLKKEREALGNFKTSKAATDIRTEDIPILNQFKDAIGETVNPSNFLGQLLATASVGIQAAGRGGAAGAGALTGALQGAIAPQDTANPQEELARRAVSSGLGAAIGGAGGAVAGKIAQKVNPSLDASHLMLQMHQADEAAASDILEQASKAFQDNPHPETQTAFKLAYDSHNKALAATEKAQKQYDKAIKRYGLPSSSEEVVPEAGPISEGVQSSSNPNAVGAVSGGAVPPSSTGGAVTPNPSPDTTAIAKRTLVTPPPPRSAPGTAAYAHTPETLDTEITRAIMQTELGEADDVVRETMRDIMSNPKHAAYAKENYEQLRQAAKQELASEIELRFAKAEAEELKLLEKGNGQADTSPSQGVDAGNSNGSQSGSADGGPESVSQSATATQDTQAANEGTGITQLNAFPQNVIDFIAKPVEIKGRVGLTPAQQRLAGIRPYKTQDYADTKPFMQRVRDWGNRIKDTATSNWTNRFNEIQKLGEDPRYAVDRYFGLSSEAGSYLSSLAAKVSDGIGNDPAMLKHFNEYLLLKRLEGRAMANPADPMVLKRFPTTQGGVGGYTEITQRLQDMEQDLGANILGEFDTAQGHVKNLISDIHQLWQDTGLFSADDIANLTAADPDYVPLASMSKALDQLEAMTSSSGKKLGVNSLGGLVKKVGEFNQVMMSDDKPALDNLIDMVERSVKLVRKNEVVRTTVEGLGKAAVPMENNTGLNLADWAPVSHHVDGKVVEHMVPRPVAEAVDKMTPQQTQGLAKFISKLTGIQTQFLTGVNPVFAVVQVVKDLPTALIQAPDVATGTLKNLPGAAKDTFTEALSGRLTPRMQEFYQAGAGGSFVDDYRAGGDFKKFGEVMPKTLLQSKNPLTMIERLNKAIDNTTRLSVYQAKKDAGANAAQAVNAARNATVDFAEGGSISKQVNQYIPFANVGIQGAKLSLDALKANYKEHPAALAAVLGTVVGVPEMASWFNNHRNPEVAKAYDDLPAYEKTANIVFILDGKKNPDTGKYDGIIKYPMNDSFKQIRGAFIAGLQYAQSQYVDDKTDGTVKNDPSYLGQMAVETIKIMPGGQFIPISADAGKPDSWGTGVSISPEPIYSALPFLMRQSVELGVNKDTFRNRDILTKREQDIAKDPAQRENVARPTTTSAARLLSKATGSTPVQTDYALDTTIFSGAGKTIKWVANQLTDQLAQAPTKTKDTSLVAQFRDRFMGAYGGNLDKRVERDNAEGLAATALRGQQRTNAKKEIKTILDQGYPQEVQASKLREVLDRIAKIVGPLDDKEINKILEDAIVEHASPSTPYIRTLKAMGKAARYQSVAEHMKDMDDTQKALFLQSLEIHKITLEAPIDPQASVVQPSKVQVAEVSPGTYRVTTRSGKVKTVTKQPDGSLVIT